MEFVSYNNELGLANILFMRPFSNIQIERTDKQGNKSWYKVPCKLGQVSRIMKALKSPERKANYRVPMIAVTRGGISRQPERINSLHNEVKYEITKSNRNYLLMTPIPIDISYQITIIAKYPSDIDRIVSNFFVFFNAGMYVSWEHPKFEGVKINSQITVSDSISEEQPDEIDEGQDDLITATLDFTFKTYMFAGTAQMKKIKVNPTVTVVSSYLSTVTSSYVYEFQNNAEVTEYLNEHGGADSESGDSSSAVGSDLAPKLSTMLTCEVQVPCEVSSISGSTSSDEDIEVYDGVPIIKKIDLGMYAVPRTESITSYMASVDNELIVKHRHYTKPAYISSESYLSMYNQVSDDEGRIPFGLYENGEYSDPVSKGVHQALSGLSGINDIYENVDNWCTLAPFVDRIRMRIDENSTNIFPDNIKMYPDVL